jgi:hypothetical protein
MPPSPPPDITSHPPFSVWSKNSIRGGGVVRPFAGNPRSDQTKEYIKKQPASRNLSATATRVLQCTCQLQLLGNIFQLFTPHLTSTHLTPCYVNNKILHWSATPVYSTFFLRTESRPSYSAANECASFWTFDNKYCPKARLDLGLT